MPFAHPTTDVTICDLPIVEEAIKRPFASVASRDMVVKLGCHSLPEIVNPVVEALTNCDVEEAYRPIWNHSGVVVACVLVPKVVRPVVNGHAALPPPAPHALPVFVILPFASVCKQLLPEDARIEGKVGKPLVSSANAAVVLVARAVDVAR